MSSPTSTPARRPVDDHSMPGSIWAMRTIAERYGRFPITDEIHPITSRAAYAEELLRLMEEGE